MFQILLAILALGLLVIVHEGGHFLLARLSKMRVDLFSIGFGPPLWRVTRGETTYQVAAIPLGGFVQIAGLNPGEEIDPEDPRAYPNRPVWQRFLTIAAGPITNYLFAVLLLIGLNLAVGIPVPGHKGAVIGDTIPDRPAAQAGLLPGDEIVAINGRQVASYTQVSALVEETHGKPVTIEVDREQQRKTFTLTPAKDGDTWRIGIAISSRQERKHMGVWPAIEEGVTGPIYLTWLNAKGIWESIHGHRKLDVQSPIGIVGQIKSRISQGWVTGIEFVAIISTLLGFFNLVPFPALDGGRLVFLGWEVITKRPVNPRVEQWVHTVGIVVLLCVMGPLLVKDAWKLIISRFLHGS